MMYFGNMPCWGMGFWWIGGLIVLGLFIWLIVSVTKRPENPLSHKESPLDILKKRYARGEITKEEFEEMSKNLR